MERLQAERRAGIQDFFVIVRDLLVQGYGLAPEQFIEAHPTQSHLEDQGESAFPKFPVISYIYARVPDPKEPKPRIRDQRPDPNRAGYTLTVMAQKFQCSVRFDVWSTSSQEADRWAYDLENLLLLATGKIRREGICDIFFQSFTVNDPDAGYKEGLVSRSLLYLVVVEDLFAYSTPQLLKFPVDVSPHVN